MGALRHAWLLPLVLSAACRTEPGTVVPLCTTEPGPVLPARPPSAPPGDGGGQVYALQHLYLGSEGPDGSFSEDAWKTLGLNLDGRVHDAPPFECHCRPVLNANPLVFTDGQEGIDNAFGSTVLPEILLPWVAGAEDESNAAIDAGEWTLLVRIDALGAAPDYDPLQAKVYEAGPLPASPTWDGSDLWPVRGESLLVPGDIEQPVTDLPSSYLAGNTWVSGAPATVFVRLRIAGVPLRLELHRAIFALEVAEDRSSAHGVLGGVLDPEQAGELSELVGVVLTPDYCAVTNESIKDRIRKASDVPLSGPHDPAEPCTGISIGLGLELVNAEIGAPLPPEAPPPDACPPP